MPGTACRSAVTTPVQNDDGVVVGRVEREPRDPAVGIRRLGQPRGEQGRLPEAGRGRDQGEPTLHALGEPVHAGAGGPPRRGAGGGRRAWSRPGGVPRVLIPPEHRREVAPRAHRTPGRFRVVGPAGVRTDDTNGRAATGARTRHVIPAHFVSSVHRVRPAPGIRSGTKKRAAAASHSLVSKRSAPPPSRPRREGDDAWLRPRPPRARPAPATGSAPPSVPR